MSIESKLSQAEARAVEPSVWELYLETHVRFVARHQRHLFPDYSTYLDQLALSTERAPSLSEIGSAIAGVGWSAASIEGFEDASTIFEHLAASRVPVSRNVRSLEHLHRSPQPDFLHDLMGHVPLVFSRELADLNRAVGQKGITLRPSALDRELYEANQTLSSLKARPSSDTRQIVRAQYEVDALSALSLRQSSAFARLSRLYLWTIEFGLLKIDGEPKVIGAGLISSHADFMKWKQGETLVQPLSEAVFSQEVSISGDQASLFVIERLEDVYRLLDMLK